MNMFRTFSNDIDLTQEGDERGGLHEQGVSAGGPRPKGIVGARKVENQTSLGGARVEKPVMSALPGSRVARAIPTFSSPRGVEGEVVVSFTVDTTGRVIMSTLNI